MLRDLPGPGAVAKFSREQLVWERTVSQGGWTVQRLKGCSQSVVKRPKPKVFCTRELRFFDLLAISLSSLTLFPNPLRTIMPTSVFGLKQLIYIEEQILAHCLAHSKFSVSANIN